MGAVSAIGAVSAEGSETGGCGSIGGTELMQAVAEDLVRVLLVERARDVRLGGNGPFDATRTTYGRNCGQIFAPLEDR